MIRNATPADAASIADIYNHYIEHTIITFEEQAVDATEIARRITKITARNYPYIVYEHEGKVVGYAYLDTWRTRSAFDITLETTVYLSPQFAGIGRGIGSELYAQLIVRARTAGIHSLIGVISLPNDASRRLHHKFGFEPVGIFREVGLKFGNLIDVEFWQLIL